MADATEEIEGAYLAAGAGYAAAVAAYWSAHVELAAIERAMHSPTLYRGKAPMACAGSGPDVAYMRHPVFNPDFASNAPDRIKARVTEIVKNRGVI